MTIVGVPLTPFACAIPDPGDVLTSYTMSLAPVWAAALSTSGLTSWQTEHMGDSKNNTCTLLAWADATLEKATNETSNAVNAIKPICFFIYFWHLFVMVVFLTYSQYSRFIL
jgi:hypothetical protein